MAQSRSLGGQVEAVVRALAAFDPGVYSGAHCAELVKTFTRAEKALAVARTLAAARAAECNEHSKEGFADPSEWLSRHAGTTARDARDHLHTIARLGALPETRAALTSGQVSLGQAAEIARTEAEVPGSEAELLPLAKTSGLSTLRDRARKTRGEAIPAEALHQRQRTARSVRHWLDELGMIAGTFRLTPEAGVGFVNRLERNAQRLRRAVKQRGETVEHFEAYAADAFANIIESSAASPTSKRRDVDAVFVCDLNAFRRGHAHEGERCHIVGGGPIPVRIAREMAKDALLKAVIHDGVNVHTIKHFGRHIPAELRTALELGRLPDLDGAVCPAEGCDRRYGLEWDHDNPVANGGETSYENVGPQCEPHHWDKTERDRKAGKHGRGRSRPPRPPPRE